jgi:hypothetical protein
MYELQSQINQKQGEILGHKSILNATDWEVIKATELGVVLDERIKQARQEARDAINTLETEIVGLFQQLELEIENIELQ